MQNHPDKLYASAQCRVLEEMAIADTPDSAYDLMCRAGEAAFHHLQQAWPWARKIVVACGVGNNGGDGYVLATLAQQHGWPVRVIAPQPPRSRTALQAREDAVSAGVNICSEISEIEADLIVDALFGIGLRKAPEGVYQTLVEKINAASARVLAMDIPSGLNPDNGRAYNPCVQADISVTFIALKPGLLTGQGNAAAGRVIFADLQLPSRFYAEVESMARIIAPNTLPKIPSRPIAGHKRSVGVLLAVGGDHGMAGAIRMTAAAACRSGAGLVQVTSRTAHLPTINLSLPEVITTPYQNAETFLVHASRADAIAIGPGMGTGSWGKALLASALAADKPLVMDADALNLLAQAPQQQANWILTPHAGEAARLLACSVAEIEADRFSAAKSIAERYHGICLLKGAGSILTDGNAKPLLCIAGNPQMASAGMGDLLTGLIGSLLAQGMPPMDAAMLGVWLHASAADALVAKGEGRGMLATDLLPQLAKLLNALADKSDEQ